MKYTGLPQENIASPHVGNGQAAPAVEETRMKEENPNERQKWDKQQLQDIAKMHPGDRVTATRITNSLQRLRKKFPFVFFQDRATRAPAVSALPFDRGS